nr:NADH dehydrogenase subunit 4L [Branchinecta gaini]
MFILVVLTFFIGLVIFLSSSKHLLVTLLSLELLILMLFVFLCFYLEFSYLNTFCFLTIAVCESALGLSLLVSLVRSSGSDLVLMLND